MQRLRDRVVQTVSQVLTAGDRAEPPYRAYFHDEPLLRTYVRARDHVLYRAERDTVPPRTEVLAGGVPRQWRVDRVTYPDADLPSGELNRSTGHWNPADQWEIFQVDEGEVVLVVRLPGAGRPTELVHCGSGDSLTLSPGMWHLTYVWRGPAVVTNAYSISAPHGGRVGKYFSRPTLRCGLRRDGDEVVVFRDEADPLQDRGAPVWRAAGQRGWAMPELPPLESLLTADRPLA